MCCVGPSGGLWSAGSLQWSRGQGPAHVNNTRHVNQWLLSFQGVYPKCYYIWWSDKCNTANFLMLTFRLTLIVWAYTVLVVTVLIVMKKMTVMPLRHVFSWLYIALYSYCGCINPGIRIFGCVKAQTIRLHSTLPQFSCSNCSVAEWFPRLGIEINRSARGEILSALDTVLLKHCFLSCPQLYHQWRFKTTICPKIKMFFEC